MIRLSAFVDLPGPVEDVFRWLDQPERVAALNPLPTRVVECRRVSNGGWFVRMDVDDEKGTHELVGESVEYQPPVRTVTRSLIRGRYPVVTARTLTTTEGGTRVTLEASYSVPVRFPWVDRLYERRWKALGQKALDKTLARWASTYPD